MKLPPLQINPADLDSIHTLFQQLLDFMTAGGYTNGNLYGTISGGVSCGITCTGPTGNTYSYSERVLGARVAISPPSAACSSGGAQQFTATVKDENNVDIPGATVTWTVSGLGTVDTAGLYRAPATVAAASTDIVSATYPDTASSAQASVSLTP